MDAFERAFFLCYTKKNTKYQLNVQERGELRKCGSIAEARKKERISLQYQGFSLFFELMLCLDDKDE